MTLHAAVYGTAIRDVELRESKSGNRFATLTVASPNGQDQNGKDISQFVKIVVFNEHIHDV
jgi:single-stranded DNA-binding protein